MLFQSVPLPKVRGPKFLEIWNPWRKVLERSGLTFENKDQEVIQHGSGGYTTRIRRLLAGFFGIGATICIG